MGVVYVPELTALKSDGTTKVTPEPKKGCSLTAGTWFFIVGGALNQIEGIHLLWDSNLIAPSIFFEDSCMPREIGTAGSTTLDVTDFSLNVGEWIREDPGTAYVSVTSTDGTTGGATVTNMHLAIAGGTAGGAMIHLGNLGSRRGRIKVVVTQAGLLRCCVHGKTGG